MQSTHILVAVLAAAVLLSTPAAAATADVEVPAVRSPDTVEMTMLLPAIKMKPDRPTRLVGFSWGDCGGADTWVKIKSLSLQPDPIDLDGKITVAFAYSASHTFGDSQPLSASLVVKKKFLGTWIQLPCINNVGSCNYDNLCSAPFPPPATCPAEFVKANVPCKCPFPAGDFDLPGYTFTVDASKIPSFLEKGDYQLSVNVNSAGSQVLCANAQATLA